LEIFEIRFDEIVRFLYCLIDRLLAPVIRIVLVIQWLPLLIHARPERSLKVGIHELRPDRLARGLPPRPPFSRTLLRHQSGSTLVSKRFFCSATSAGLLGSAAKGLSFTLVFRVRMLRLWRSLHISSQNALFVPSGRGSSQYEHTPSLISFSFPSPFST